MPGLAAPIDGQPQPQPQDDHFVERHGVTWSEYEQILEERGDRAGPRISYLDGRLEIMSPSRGHESKKSVLGCLVEAWCLEHDVEFSTYGHWTLKDESKASGAEPDECYVFGTVAEPQRPDLAIEVVWTRGGLDKLEIYRRLGVREVWYWKNGRLTVHVLRDGNYHEVPRSEALPSLDLEQLASFLDRPTTSQAIRDYRNALRGSDPG